MQILKISVYSLQALDALCDCCHDCLTWAQNICGSVQCTEPAAFTAVRYSKYFDGKSGRLRPSQCKIARLLGGFLILKEIRAQSFLSFTQPQMEQAMRFYMCVLEKMLTCKCFISFPSLLNMFQSKHFSDQFFQSKFFSESNILKSL